MLHGEPAWLFGAVHSPPSLRISREVTMDAPPNGSCESVSNALEAHRKTTSQPDDSNGWPCGHYCVVFSIDRPPLLAVRRTVMIQPNARIATISGAPRSQSPIEYRNLFLR